MTTRQADNNGKAVDVFIVSSYAPTSAHSEAEWEAYYDALSAALARRLPNATPIIGADTKKMTFENHSFDMVFFEKRGSLFVQENVSVPPFPSETV